MFRGEAVSQLTVTTDGGGCLPEIVAGDRWLFYLRRDEKTKKLLLEYGDPGAPIADAQKDIARLRRLGQMTDFGLVVGNLHREVWEVDEDGAKSTTSLPVPMHKVIAKRESDGTEFSALTDNDGDYEFEPLPSGSYYLSANTTPGLWADEGSAKVQSRGCTEFQFELHTDGGISGHVKSADGKPLEIYPSVKIQSEDGESSKSFNVDDHGYFEARGLDPGRYLVGIGIAADPDTPEWRSRVYYPGVRTKEEATIIELGKAEKRTNIDFQLPGPIGR
jgi:hypothetical protein